MKRRVFLTASATAGLGAGLAACGLTPAGSTGAVAPSGSPGGGAKTALTIYSPRPKVITDHIIAAFRQSHPKYEVRLLTLGAGEVADRVRAEKANPQADVWWGGTPSLYETAQKDGQLEKFSDAVVNRVPQQYRGTNSEWLAEMLQLQLIIYNKDMIKESDVPKDWADLIKPDFSKKIIIRDVAPSGTMRGIFTSLIYQEYAKTKSPDAGYAYLKALDKNTVDYAANPEALYLRLTRQEAAISLWNHQDTLTQAKGGAPFAIHMPTSGAPLNLDGIAKVKGSKNTAGAEDFARFVFDDAQQTWLANNAFQIPTIEIKSKPEWLQKLTIKELPVDRAVLAANEKAWIDYWLANIKNQGGK